MSTSHGSLKTETKQEKQERATLCDSGMPHGSEQTVLGVFHNPAEAPEADPPSWDWLARDVRVPLAPEPIGAHPT